MAVSIVTKTKTQSKKAESVDIGELLQAKYADEVDTLYRLQEDIKSLRDSLAILETQYKEKKKPILDDISNSDADENQSFIIKGENHNLTVGKQPKAIEITDKEALYEEMEKVEEGLFFELCTVGVTKVKEYIGEKHSFLKKISKGDRRFSFK